MTMNVTTAPVSPAVPGDASATGQPGNPDEVGEQFADALAGFLGEAPTGQGEPSDLSEAPLMPGTETTSTAVVALVPLMRLVPAAIASATVTAAVAAITPATAKAAASAGPELALGTAPGQTAAVGSATGATDGALVPDGAALSSSTVGTSTATTDAAPSVTPKTTPFETTTPTPTAPASNDAHSLRSPTTEAMSALTALGVAIVAEDGTPASKTPPITLPETVATLTNGEVAPTAPTSGPAPTTPVTVTIPAAPATASRPVQVAQQVATQVAFLSGAVDGTHTMTLQITPDNLGPVQVQVTVTDGALDMTLLAALEVGRDTLTQAAPELRRYLEAAGLTCNSVEVDLSNDQSSWFTQPDADRDSEAHQPSNRREQAGTPSGDNSDSPENPADAATRPPTSTGVDLRL